VCPGTTKFGLLRAHKHWAAEHYEHRRCGGGITDDVTNAKPAQLRAAISVPRMSSELLAVTLDAHDVPRLAQFWSGVLGREVVEGVGDALLPGDDTQLGLRFVPCGTEKKVGPNRMHFHLTSTSSADQRQTVTTVLELGARHIDVGQRPEEGHVVLADPEGNEFCVIEPDNAFLAGCGFLGELACDGTREVGIFWSEALGWPLVWDHDQETAIQSPHGGTKVAWGGPPVASKEGRNRQRFYLAAVDGDQAAEVDRLVWLGATRLEVGLDGVVVLADPDGNEFCVKAG
jgi:catechol 2,3-dioxygenase-like lactoylglutathione lyase family enzyme